MLYHVGSGRFYELGAGPNQKGVIFRVGTSTAVLELYTYWRRCIEFLTDE
jgi:hypothetical protein